MMKNMQSALSSEHQTSNFPKRCRVRNYKKPLALCSLKCFIQDICEDIYKVLRETASNRKL